MTQTNVDGFTLDRAGQRHMLDLLAQIPEVVRDLDVTLTKQDRFGSGDRTSGGDTCQPLPYNIAASEAADTLRGTLAFWAFITTQDRHVDGPAFDDTKSLAQWLRIKIIELAFSTNAHLAPGQLAQAIRECRQTSDRPTEPELPPINQTMLDEAHDRLLNVNGLATLAKELDDPYLTKKRISNLLTLGHIHPVGTIDGIHLYRLGQVLQAHNTVRCNKRDT